jgi:hypothetical protein
MRAFIYASAVVLCLTTVRAEAQTPGAGATTSAPSRAPLKIDVSQFKLDHRAPADRSSSRVAQSSTRSSGKSVTRRIFGGIVGATAGLFAGGYIGQAIEGDSCHCDDPGLMGALIGAPIGAVAGGILGALYLF